MASLKKVVCLLLSGSNIGRPSWGKLHAVSGLGYAVSQEPSASICKPGSRTSNSPSQGKLNEFSSGYVFPDIRKYRGWRTSCTTLYTLYLRNCNIIGVLSGARFPPSIVLSIFRSSLVQWSMVGSRVDRPCTKPRKTFLLRVYVLALGAGNGGMKKKMESTITDYI